MSASNSSGPAPLPASGGTSGRSFLAVPAGDGEVYCFASALGGGAVGGDDSWLVEAFADWTSVGAGFDLRRRARVEHVQRMADRASRAAALPGRLRELVLPVAGPASYRATFGPLRAGTL